METLLINKEDLIVRKEYCPHCGLIFAFTTIVGNGTSWIKCNNCGCEHNFTLDYTD